MILRDFHVHTAFCDGKASPEEMVKAAVSMGISDLGIVTHSYVPFDTCCISPENIDVFKGELRRLKSAYRDKIRLFCGVEMDLFSSQSREGFDYVIGSTHYLKHGDKYISVDESPEILQDMIDKYYDGDFYACAGDYFKNVAAIAKMQPDIIGHFDLIRKFSRIIPFDPENPRYIAAWQSAADELLTSGSVFEVNTGGISRGWLSEPYPAPVMCEYIKSHGGKLILSSDAHSSENLAFDFEKWQILL